MASDLREERGATAANWRTEPHLHWAFHHVRQILPVADIAAGPNARALPEALMPAGAFAIALMGGGTMDMPAFLEATATDALVILRDGAVVFEAYANGTAATSPHILMSSSKAMMGLLAGVLKRDGDLDLEAPASRYVPEIAASGFAGATVRQLLDMRTGVTVADRPAYDAAVSSLPGQDGSTPALHDLLPQMTAAKPHGGPFSYISANTDLAGWAMERATGMSVARLFSERLWKPMGAEHDAYIITDAAGSAWCSGGLCATARDFARVGDLMVNDGRRGGVDIIPKAWIDDLTEGGDREAWRTGEWGQSFAFLGSEMSYRAGWYAVHGDLSSLFAMGVHGQNLFVDRANRVVIAKLSSLSQGIDARAIWLTHAAVPGLVEWATGAAHRGAGG